VRDLVAPVEFHEFLLFLLLLFLITILVLIRTRLGV